MTINIVCMIRSIYDVCLIVPVSHFSGISKNAEQITMNTNSHKQPSIMAHSASNQYNIQHTQHIEREKKRPTKITINVIVEMVSNREKI